MQETENNMYKKLHSILKPTKIVYCAQQLSTDSNDWGLPWLSNSTLLLTCTVIIIFYSMCSAFHRCTNISESTYFWKSISNHLSKHHDNSVFWVQIMKLTIQLLNTMTIIIWKLEVRFETLIPRKHKSTRHRWMWETQRMTKFMSCYCK